LRLTLRLSASPSNVVKVLARRFVALLLLALWLPVTQHCDLEAAGFSCFGHEHHGESAQHDPCADDACRTIEEIGWVKDFGAVRVPPPDALPLLDLMAALTATPLGVDVELVESVADAEPDLLRLTRTWVFTRRAAWPSRAPNITAS
jgi:hypothetical protein